MDFKAVERKVSAQLKGQAAEGLLAQVREHFEVLQARYIQQLIGRTLGEGAPAEAEVWKLVALSEVFEDLASEVAAGRRATKKLESEATKS